MPTLPPLSFATRLTNHFKPLLLVIPTSSDAVRDMDAVMQIATFAVDEESNVKERTSEDSASRLNLSVNGFQHDQIGESEKWEGEMTEKEFERGMNAVAELQDL